MGVVVCLPSRLLAVVFGALIVLLIDDVIKSVYVLPAIR